MKIPRGKYSEMSDASPVPRRKKKTHYLPKHHAVMFPPQSQGAEYFFLNFGQPEYCLTYNKQLEKTSIGEFPSNVTIGS